MGSVAQAWPLTGRRPGSDEAEFGELLRWLASGNFTFLGYRDYDLVRAEHHVACAPCPEPGSASCGTTGRVRIR